MVAPAFVFVHLVENSQLRRAGRIPTQSDALAVVARATLVRMVRAPRSDLKRTMLVVACALALSTSTACQALMLRLAGVPTSPGTDGKRGTAGAVCPPDCAYGFQCLELEPGAPVCRASCVVGKVDACATGTVCRALADGDTDEGVCVPVDA